MATVSIGKANFLLSSSFPSLFLFPKCDEDFPKCDEDSQREEDDGQDYTDEHHPQKKPREVGQKDQKKEKSNDSPPMMVLRDSITFSSCG